MFTLSFFFHLVLFNSLTKMRLVKHTQASHIEIKRERESYSLQAIEISNGL